jgi:hypothetical protein
MNRESSQTIGLRTLNESVAQVRCRMIRETEAFLNKRLFRRNGDWATRGRVSCRLKQIQDESDRRQAATWRDCFTAERK